MTFLKRSFQQGETELDTAFGPDQFEDTYLSGDWRKVRSLIERTKTKVVTDNSVPFWKFPESIIKYGTMIVR